MQVTQYSARITPSENITATFDKQIDFFDSNFVTLHELVGNTEIPTPITSEIGYLGNIVTVNPSIDLKTGVEYSLKFSQGAVRTLSGDAFPSVGTSSHALIFQIVETNNYITPSLNPPIPSSTYNPYVPVPLSAQTTPTLQPSSVPSVGSFVPLPVQTSVPIPSSNISSQISQSNQSPSTSDDLAKISFDSQVDDYKVGTASSDRIVVSGDESAKSWALWGFGGNDTLIGGLQDDYLVGGDGNDVLTGGKGSDVFVLSEKNKTVDRIKDFSPKQDAIGVSNKLIAANNGDTVAIAKLSDVKGKSAASKFFKARDADHYVIVDSASNIKNLNSIAYSDKIRLAVDLTNNRILYDADGNWARGSIELAKLDGKTTFGSWSASNFAFGIELG